MMKLTLSKVFRFFLAFTMALGMLISAVNSSVSHLPTNLETAQQTRHAELAPQIDDHGHSHDDGEFEEQHVNHTHGHDPTDHSHETPHISAYPYSVKRTVVRNHPIDIAEFIELGAFDRLDRPPKPTSLI